MLTNILALLDMHAGGTPGSRRPGTSGSGNLETRGETTPHSLTNMGTGHTLETRETRLWTHQKERAAARSDERNGPSAGHKVSDFREGVRRGRTRRSLRIQGTWRCVHPACPPSQGPRGSAHHWSRKLGAEGGAPRALSGWIRALWIRGCAGRLAGVPAAAVYMYGG